jgi:hypothetical protein
MPAGRRHYRKTSPIHEMHGWHYRKAGPFHALRRWHYRLMRRAKVSLGIIHRGASTMTDNRIPQNYEPLVVALEHAIAGARQCGEAVGLKQNNADSLSAALVNLTGAGVDAAATVGHKARWSKAKAAKSAAVGALRAVENQGRALASACIGILKPRFGKQWNSAWQEVGLIGDSLKVPSHPLVTLRHLQAYFAAHPEYEVVNAAAQLNCTAKACAEAAAAIVAADAASRQSNLDAGAAQQNLQQSLQAARGCLTGLRAELSQLLADDDPRWFLFGFDRPGHLAAPEIPANLVLTAGLAGTLFADWDDAPRADTYRASVADAEGKTLAERVVAESEAMFTGLPSGAKVQVTVTARNAAGESRACAAVEAVVA